MQDALQSSFLQRFRRRASLGSQTQHGQWLSVLRHLLTGALEQVVASDIRVSTSLHESARWYQRLIVSLDSAVHGNAQLCRQSCLGI